MSNGATFAEVDTHMETISTQETTTKGKHQQGCVRTRAFKIKKGFEGNVAHNVSE